jgi:RNA polymerase sigma factor for flagellar operon FliA
MSKVKSLTVESYREFNDYDKEQVIKSYLPLVRRVVHRLSAKLPREVDFNEMLSSGVIGLVDALEKYDASLNTSFVAYAQFRIKGAILDSFRSQDWLPRSLRQRSQKLEEAYRTVEQKLGRAASDEEVSRELGVEVEELRTMLSEVGNILMLSFEEMGFGHGEERFQADEALTSREISPLNQLLTSEKIDLIARALDRLPEKERLVISLYFYEELNLKEIADILNVTESRASQIRSKALIRLRVYLRNAIAA